MNLTKTYIYDPKPIKEVFMTREMIITSYGGTRVDLMIILKILFYTSYMTLTKITNNCHATNPMGSFRINNAIDTD